MSNEPVNNKTVAIYGAGIAGLSAAHSLAQHGWQVSVFETNSEAGGFFRSARKSPDRNMPSEYSWHGLGPWYHNVFDVMRQIPFDATGSVYERALSRPVDFGVAPDQGSAQFDNPQDITVDVARMFRMSRVESLRWLWVMVKTWAAQRRSREYYSRLNAAEQFRPLLSKRA